MPGAPVLNGVAGSMLALLDACLVNGFGSKSATSLVVASGIATLNFTGGASAAIVDGVITVAGATPSNLNGEQKLLSASSTQVTFATAEANGAATGTITFKVSGANWLKPYTGTNLAAYQSQHGESSKPYLRLDDTGTTTCRVVGYESMSDINTGLGPFPTPAMYANGGFWAKSTVANSTANAWILVADERSFILWVAPAYGASALNKGGVARGFGDFIAFKPSGDGFGSFLNIATTGTVTAHNTNGLDYMQSTTTHMFAPRAYTALGVAAPLGSYPYTGSASAMSGVDSMLGVFPSPVDGRLRLSKRYVAAGGTTEGPRGDLPGLYSVPHTETSESFPFGTVIAGSGPVAGRKLVAISPTNQTFGTTSTLNNTGTSFIDITGPWR